MAEKVEGDVDFLRLEALSQREGLLLCPDDLEGISFIDSDCDFICNEVCGTCGGDGGIGVPGGEDNGEGAGSMAVLLLMPRTTVALSRSPREGLDLWTFSCIRSASVTRSVGSEEETALRDKPCQKLELRDERKL
jgi:hypothetical protein